MRATRVLVTTALLAAAALAAPAGAAGAGPCGDPGSSRVARVGAPLAAPVATPAEPFYLGETPVDVLVELPEGEDAPTAADVTIELSWDSAASDFDLQATGPDGTESASLATNAIEGTVETVTVTGAGQCDSISVVVQNFAGLPVEALTLTLVTTPVDS